MTTIVFRLKLTHSFFAYTLQRKQILQIVFLFLCRKRLGSSIVGSRRFTFLEVGSVEGLGGALVAAIDGFHGHKDINSNQLGDSGAITRERRQDRFVVYLLAFVIYV